ncbi:MAG: Cytochrome c biosis factor [Chthonomonadaceae bacterium]|nr:Cytochrome c biosis factor [Chthonomonadaceae bacterium]
MQSKLTSRFVRFLPLLAGIALVGGFLYYLIGSVSQAQHENSFSNASAKDLAAAQAHTPDNPGVMYELAHRLERDGKNEDARALMQKLVQKEPQNLTYWKGLARCAAESGHALDALDAYKKGYELSPQWAVGHLKRGEILASAGLTTEALQEYDLGAKIDPGAETNVEPWARSLLAKGRDQEAWDRIVAGTKKIMLSDGCYELLTDAGIRLGRTAEADTILENRISFTASYPAGKFHMCELRVALADKPDAATLKAMEVVAFNATHETYPLPECYAMLGKIRMLRGDLTGAESALKTGITLKTGDTSVCLEELAEVYHRTGRAEQEKQIRSRIRKETGETPELAALRQAAHLAPHDTATLSALAKALEAAGKFGEAADTYENILTISPQDPTASAKRDPLRRKALEQLDKAGRKIATETPPE